METSSPPFPISLSPRRSCDSSTSLDFEFNPSFPSPTALPSADELFFAGVIRPLHRLPTTNHHSYSHSDPGSPPDLDPDPSPPFSSANATADFVSDPANTDPEAEPGPAPDSDPSPSILSPGITASKRWRGIFKKSEKKPPNEEKKEKKKEKQKEKKRDRKNGGTGTAAGGSNSAELNINLWPFSRSRSAGNSAAGRPRSAVAARKVSSAPCSRSNSAGESKSRRWPSSPGRVSGGVHVGRASPVWQVPRMVSSRPEKVKKETGMDNRWSKAVKGGTSVGGATGSGGGGKGKVLNLNVPMCIEYRHHLSCRSDETSAIRSSCGGGGRDSGGQGVTGGSSRTVGSSGGNLFNLRSLFSKKVY